MKSYLNLLTFVIWFYSCGSSQIQQYSLDESVGNYFTQSINIADLLGGQRDDYRVISNFIKDNRLIVIYCLNPAKFDPNQPPELLEINLKSKQIVTQLSLNFYPDYYQNLYSLADFNDSAFVIISPLKTSDIYIVNRINKNIKIKHPNNNYTISPHEIILNGNNVFLLRDIYGFSVYNLKTDSINTFHSDLSTGLIIDNSSTISYPIEQNINLVSGHRLTQNGIMVYAIDSLLSILWSSEIPTNEKSQISILNVENTYYLKYDNVLLGLDKGNGNINYKEKFLTPIDNIYKLDKHILVSTRVASDLIYYVIDNETHDEICKFQFESKGPNSEFVFENKIFLSDQESFRVIDLLTGKLITVSKYNKDKASHFIFETLIDIKTGKYYLKVPDGTYFW